MLSDKRAAKLVLAGLGGELSRWQLEHTEQAILAQVPSASIDRKEHGDASDAPLKALREGVADLVVFDARSLVGLNFDGISVAGTLHRGVVNDALVCHEHLGFRDLPPKATIAVSPGRRRASLTSLRDDLTPVVEELTLEERVARIDRGELDSAMFSWVELRRLGLAWRVDDVFGVTELLPEPLAGMTAILARADDSEMIELAGAAGHTTTLGRLRVELAFMQALEAKEHDAIACHSRDYGVEGMRLVARVFNADGSEMIEAERSIQREETPEVLGKKVAAELLERGAGKLLGR